MNKITLGISSCLLGEKVRCDGGHKLDHFLTDTLGKYVEWLTVRTGVDHTRRMRTWAKKKVVMLERKELCGTVAGVQKSRLLPGTACLLPYGAQVLGPIPWPETLRHARKARCQRKKGHARGSS